MTSRSRLVTTATRATVTAPPLHRLSHRLSTWSHRQRPLSSRGRSSALVPTAVALVARRGCTSACRPAARSSLAFASSSRHCPMRHLRQLRTPLLHRQSPSASLSPAARRLAPPPPQRCPSDARPNSGQPHSLATRSPRRQRHRPPPPSPRRTPCRRRSSRCSAPSTRRRSRARRPHSPTARRVATSRARARRGGRRPS